MLISLLSNIILDTYINVKIQFMIKVTGCGLKISIIVFQDWMVSGSEQTVQQSP